MKKARSDGARPLPIEDLRWRCDPATLGFETTEHVRPLDAFVGQERAVNAINLALHITAPDYNVFVAGAEGTGRASLTFDLLRKAAVARPASSDWCYVHNFPEPGRPIAIELPPGKGGELAADLEALIERCRADLPSLIEANAGKRATGPGIARLAVGEHLDALRRKYVLVPGVIRHLGAIQKVLSESVDSRSGTGAEPPIWTWSGANVFVTRDPAAGAPVVYEPNPTLSNLVGRIDYPASPLGMDMDFKYIRAGAIQRANGGYLVMYARDLLANRSAYDALRRALREGVATVESPSNLDAALPVATLRPDPIPLRIRVVLIGDPELYMRLRKRDEDFAHLFQVKAELTAFMDRSPAAIQTYASFVARIVRERGLLPFSADAVGRVIEEGARLAEDRTRLTARFGLVEDLLIEADAAARARAEGPVSEVDVSAALEARGRRSNLVEEELQRRIHEGVVVIETDTKVVGQVNGLAVRELGDYSFARPTRITARTGPGFEEVLDIERQIHLSGPSHTKGVLTLEGYLLGKYGPRRPLCLTARLTFEQNYGGVDGDSASSPELYAVLSSLADLPIDQGIAVTGSVDQRGDVQAIGGVNEKIEGHFAVCKARGLTGRQGVIIPKTNVRDLMLDPEVIGAIAAGQFHVWAVTSIDEGIELLTGVPAGRARSDGTYPPESVHGRVQARLAEYAENLDPYVRPPRSSANGHPRTAKTLRSSK